MKALAQAVGGVTGTDVVVQTLERQQRHDDAAVPVHDGFGQPRGATRIHNPQRMVERQPLGFEGVSFSIIQCRSACPLYGVSYQK